MCRDRFRNTRQLIETEGSSAEHGLSSILLHARNWSCGRHAHAAPPALHCTRTASSDPSTSGVVLAPAIRDLGLDYWIFDLTLSDEGRQR
jgi:hypothetical protein